MEEIKVPSTCGLLKMKVAKICHYKINNVLPSANELTSSEDVLSDVMPVKVVVVDIAEFSVVITDVESSSFSVVVGSVVDNGPEL